MCESGKKCYEGESCGARVDQLKRLIWMLMIWVSILSLGLGASITLHIILRQGSNTMVSPNSIETTASPRSQLTSYCLDKSKNDEHELRLQWRKKNEAQRDTAVKIEEDGNYFLFLRVTLEYRKQGVNYVVTVKKMPDGNTPSNITMGHINGTENSTGFMGIGVQLSKNTLINVTCSPQAQFDVHNTYLGLIKF
ncbi:tumor necrosis factor ligand superfamily member 18 [Pangasianodon hypophthalmus]|uniref:tumor necrosis factor ligand superfamily member 18 n=1 Tax=Pangasianodon hypophthalmus TaxID=310915 RepID=UPI001480991A|nr:tumor necrosis factor ligand superfamily member 18 [Pangasianodon hypophthalmus]